MPESKKSKIKKEAKKIRAENKVGGESKGTRAFARKVAVKSAAAKLIGGGMLGIVLSVIGAIKYAKDKETAKKAYKGRGA